MREKWTKQVKDSNELKNLAQKMMSWSPEGWVSEKNKKTVQTSLF